jgi:hypothetical protein
MGQQEHSAEELAKKTQNPVADLISVPLQSNFNFGTGFRHNKMLYVLNIQPVIPIKLSDEWNLITRTIMPVINQPSLFPTFGGLVPSTTGTGFGDFNPTFFFSPAKPGELIWGLGPTFTLPTATELLQPFVNYNLPDGWYFVTLPIVTADWKADRGGDVWTAPVGGGVGKLFRLGQILPLEGPAIAKLPINTQLTAYGNVAKPEFGPEWQLRFQIQFLFPK